MAALLLEVQRPSPLTNCKTAWCVGRHEVDGAENVYAAVNKNVLVVSVDYRL